MKKAKKHEKDQFVNLNILYDVRIGASALRDVLLQEESRPVIIGTMYLRI